MKKNWKAWMTNLMQNGNNSKTKKNLFNKSLNSLKQKSEDKGQQRYVT